MSTYRNVTWIRRFLTAAELGLWMCLAIGVGADSPAPVFSGTNSYVLVGTPNALQMSTNTPFTIEGWINVRAFDATDMLYCKNTIRTSPYTYLFGVRTSGTMLSAYTGAGGSPANTWRDVTLSPALAINRWYHLAFSFDGATLSYYVDGGLKGTNAFSYVNYATHTIKIGGFSSTTPTDIAGMESDVRVWNCARTGAEIALFKSRRLTGRELGLLGYWPLNEGTGTNAFDGTINASTGAIYGASWTNDSGLTLQSAPAGFVYGSPFSLGNLKTGSTRFTNSNEVNLVACSVPQDCDRFQITESGDPTALGAWQTTNAILERVVFSQPVSDTNVTLYAWFTNSTQNVPLRRSEGAIIYTAVPPAPVILTNCVRELVSGYYVVLNPGDVDNGSTGGEAAGETMTVYQRSLTLIAGPDTNSTPGSPSVTVASLGNYTLTLTVMNEAGNMATSAATCNLSVIPAVGQFSWSGSGLSSDWFQPLNWMPIGLPVSGSVVRIDNAASILLTNATPLLGDLWVSNATLTVSNWMTAIRADTVRIGEGGVVTLPGAFTNNAMSNRVYVVCGDFSLLPGGVIDADGKGYDGGFGPSGAGAGTRLSGAGYGGRGSCNPQWGGSQYGVAYGTVSGPLQPGSGGCGIGYGGAGGGLVQVEASGTIALHGAIRANGNSSLPVRYSGPGGGSGGGVYLSCRTFTGGADGSISVRGGIGVKEKVTPPAGRGGGGRVAIHYQSASPWPAVSIDADVGSSGAIMDGYGETHSAQWGTLFVSDGSLLGGVTSLNPGTWAVSNVALWVGGVSEWAPGNLTVSNVAFYFGDTGLLVKVDGALRVDAGGRWGASRIAAGAVTLNNGGILDVRAGPTNGTAEWGGWLDVANDLQIKTNAVLRLFSNAQNGGAPRVRVRDMVVAAGGLVDARAKGFKNAAGPGAGAAASRRRGGGYGGQGANGSVAGTTDGLPYGSAIGPLKAGSGGCYDGRGGEGGGLAHIEATGAITLNGVITAQGGNAIDADDNYAGGGSGGGVFLACHSFYGGLGGSISAQGGAGRTSAGGGGGGRIALWTGITSQRFDGFWSRAKNGDTFSEAIIATNALPRSFSGGFTNTILLDGGGPVARTGESGTFRWMTVREGSIIIVR